ncbi:UPF0149 family protein [Pokkaliibacter sp. CJK22405]|uniref:UPF0149 family protein n=1 Tax=Pokkaliibacter sp. CJK22405 TaxID=3384615 RepID=UPI0039849C5B
MSDATVTPDFETLSNTLLQLGALGSPAELHGALCGYLSASLNTNKDSNEEGWQRIARQILDVENLGSEAQQALFNKLFAATDEQLRQGVFEFELLLPEDDYSIAQRSEALGFWCSGFMNGFALAGGRIDEKADDDVREAFTDLSRFTQLTTMSLEEQESDEADLMELTEYVRVVAVMLYTEMHGVQQDPQADQPPLLH